MITAVALMCAFETTNDCEPIVKGVFFDTVEDCRADLGNALDYAGRQGGYIRDYRCIVWGEPV